MKNRDLKSEKDYINVYQEKGYNSEFRMVDDNLTNLSSGAKYKPSDVYIVAEHRFEGISNPGDMSILYVIEKKDDAKGTILANYSPARVTTMAEFFNDVPKSNVSDKASILNI